MPDEFEGDVVVPHIATLWVLDRDKDGRFSDEDIHAFADEMGKYTHGLVREDWKDYLIGNFYMQLHDDVLRPKRDGTSRERKRRNARTAESVRGGVENEGVSNEARDSYRPYLDWFSRMCLANEPGGEGARARFASARRVRLRRHRARVYLAFNVPDALRADSRPARRHFAFQTFLETLHVDAEESDLMELEAEELDDYVPLETLLKWVRGVLRGDSSVNVNVPGTRAVGAARDAPVAMSVSV